METSSSNNLRKNPFYKVLPYLGWSDLQKQKSRTANPIKPTIGKLPKSIDYADDDSSMDMLVFTYLLAIITQNNQDKKPFEALIQNSKNDELFPLIFSTYQQLQTAFAGRFIGAFIQMAKAIWETDNQGYPYSNRQNQNFLEFLKQSFNLPILCRLAFDEVIHEPTSNEVRRFLAVFTTTQGDNTPANAQDTQLNTEKYEVFLKSVLFAQYFFNRQEVIYACQDYQRKHPKGCKASAGVLFV